MRQLPDKFRNFQISRPEILPPLGDAVRLIHRDHGYLNPAVKRKVKKPIRHKPLRGDVDNLVPSRLRKLQSLHILPHRQRAVQIRRMDARLVKGAHLILHQRDQRRYDKGNPLRHKRRHLKADRLSRARRHDAKHIPPAKHRTDKSCLPFPEILIAKILL